MYSLAKGLCLSIILIFFNLILLLFSGCVKIKSLNSEKMKYLHFLPQTLPYIFPSLSSMRYALKVVFCFKKRNQDFWFNHDNQDGV